MCVLISVVRKLHSNSHTWATSSAFTACLPCCCAFLCSIPKAHRKWMRSDRPQCNNTDLTWIPLPLHLSTFPRSAKELFFFNPKHNYTPLYMKALILFIYQQGVQNAYIFTDQEHCGVYSILMFYSLSLIKVRNNTLLLQACFRNVLTRWIYGTK